MNGARDCEFCDGQHRLMEACPEAPGFRAILRGERGPRWRAGVIAVLCVNGTLAAVLPLHFLLTHLH